MGLARETLREDQITITAENNVIAFIGSIASTNPGSYLDPFFKKLHNAIVSDHLPAVTLDCTQLEFLNSSGIRSFVSWFLWLNALPQNKKYNIDILYSREQTWQEDCFTALTMLNPLLLKKKTS
jgi:hypothetical protein